MPGSTSNGKWKSREGAGSGIKTLKWNSIKSGLE